MYMCAHYRGAYTHISKAVRRLRFFTQTNRSHPHRGTTCISDIYPMGWTGELWEAGVSMDPTNPIQPSQEIVFCCHFGV